MLDYRLLEALAKVVREGGFDKAARQMNLTQSAVSQRIRQLEDQTGTVLLTRTLPPMPTARGKVLIKHYIQVEQLESDLTRRVWPETGTDFQTMSLGINADSLATWFYPAVSDFLAENRVVLDLKVDDQDQTHKRLRNGEVMGCISSQQRPVQGCQAFFLGIMNYRLVCTPGFRAAFFPSGLTRDSLRSAPAVIYNHEDDLHARFLAGRFEADLIRQLPAHFVPSPEKFLEIILDSQAYGMVPDLQGRPFLDTGDLRDLAPGHLLEVPLYWHRWHLETRLLDRLSKAIVKNAMIC